MSKYKLGATAAMLIKATMTTMTTCVPLTPAGAHDSAENTINQFLTSLIDRKKTPGLQYIMTDADQVIYRFNGGYADLIHQKPVIDETTFNAYSVTKTFTAAALVKLALEEKVDLDKPVAHYLDYYPYLKSPSLRQTLHHMGGFPNPNPMAWIHLAREDKNFNEAEFVHKIVQEHNRLDYDPGEKLAYSNIGYLLLGEVIKNVSGQPFDGFITQHIINPLLLQEDHRLAFNIEIPQQHAHGYIRKWYWLNFALGWFIDRDTYLGGSADGWIEFQDFLVNGKAYGGLIGNAAGFARYLQAMLREETPFTPRMLELLWQPGVTQNGQTTPRGLAWMRGSLNNALYYSHTGGAGGYYCEMRIYPVAKRASVIMTNNTGLSGQHYLDSIDPFFLNQGEQP